MSVKKKWNPDVAAANKNCQAGGIMRTGFASSRRALAALAVALCVVSAWPAQAITSNNHFTSAVPLTGKTAYTGVFESGAQPCTGLFGADDPVNRIDPSGHDDIGDVLGAMDISFSLDALPHVTTVQGALSGGGTCGPDVTAAVLNTTIDVEQTFLNAPLSVQAQAVNNIYTPAIGDGWDIDPLASLGFGGRPDFGNGSTLGSGSGERTVQFGNPPKVYYAGSLNYILWGRMFRLAAVKFGNPLTGSGAPAYSEVTAEAAAWTYKSVFWRDFGDSKKEADAFVHFGYDGTDPSSTALPLTPNPSNVGASARFNWKWIGLHDVAE